MTPEERLWTKYFPKLGITLILNKMWNSYTKSIMIGVTARHSSVQKEITVYLFLVKLIIGVYTN